MIKSNELRIGDLFYPIERKDGVDIPQEVPFVVAEIFHFSVKFPFAVRAYPFGKKLTEVRDSELVSFTTHKISPIPLTEEWLLRMGFKEFNSNWYKIQYFTDCQENPEVMEIQINLVSNRCGVNDQDSEDGIAMTGKRIQYVHRLQNLYFALTGEELELKSQTT